MDIFGCHFLSLEILCDCIICNYPMNLSEHRREVEDYMFALLSDEELKEAYGDYRHEQGLEQGLAQGLETLIGYMKKEGLELKSVIDKIRETELYKNVSQVDIENIYKQN